ncbi:MAG: bifunctional ornithine acetyltransferase/N-acetylglutamate synthase, partial [Myxococcota bacterium]
LSAAGTAEVELTEQDMTLCLGEHVVFRQGTPTQVDRQALSRTFAQEQVDVHLSLGGGEGRAHMVTTDLTQRYVEINSEYTT